ncbi:MAG: InlB B-repeat-containing protein [Oscillospiraceae bacterium]|nr:InlB B-repeat-containing protein [Oscillospiraceae bacterium]
MKTKSLKALLGIVLAVAMAAFGAGVFTVSAMPAGSVTLSSNPGVEYTTLHDAVADAASGDTITVSGAITEDQQIFIGFPLTIEGATGAGTDSVTFTTANTITAAPSTLVLDNIYYGWLNIGLASDNTVDVNATITVSGLTLESTGSSGDTGPANPTVISVFANDFTVSNCVIIAGDTNSTDDVSGFGGSNISCYDGLTGLTVENNTFETNGTGSIYGMYININTQITISGNTFTGTYTKRAITVDTATDVSITGNTFNSVSGDPTMGQVLFWSAASDPSILNLTDNTFINTADSSVTDTYPIVIYADSPVDSGSTVTGNAFLGYPSNADGLIVGIFDQSGTNDLALGAGDNVNGFDSGSDGQYLFGQAFTVSGQLTNVPEGSMPTEISYTTAPDSGTAANKTAAVDTDGNFTFPVAAGNTIKLTAPAVTGYVPNPASITLTAVDANMAENNFDYIDANTVFTVSFNVGDGSAVVDQQVKVGNLLTQPDDPTLKGYKFDGWYQDEACTIPWIFDTDTVMGNITLFAKWTSSPDTGVADPTDWLLALAMGAFVAVVATAVPKIKRDRV